MANGLFLRTLLPRILRRIRIEGIEHLPKHGPFLLAANHVSYLEPVLLAALMTRKTNQRVYALTKQSVWKFFHAIGLSEWFGMMPVFRSHPERVVDIAKERLRRGFPVLIFPEGTRSRDGELGKGKTGIARLALSTGAPVIPAAYTGRPTRTTIESLRVYFQPNEAITIRLGKPLTFSSAHASHDDLERVTATVMKQIGDLLQKPYRFSS